MFVACRACKQFGLPHTVSQIDNMLIENRKIDLNEWEVDYNNNKII